MVPCIQTNKFGKNRTAILWKSYCKIKCFCFFVQAKKLSDIFSTKEACTPQQEKKIKITEKFALDQFSYVQTFNTEIVCFFY